VTGLPRGWVRRPLAELGRSIKGSIQPRDTERYELYSVPAFADRAPEQVEGSEIGSHKRPVAQGDLLICKINPRINRVWCVAPASDAAQIASPEWLVLRVSDDVLTRFLEKQLSSPEFRRWIEEGTHGVTGSHTRAKDERVLQFSALVAPTAEQERIVAAIEVAFSKLDAGEAYLRAARQRLHRMRDSVLTAAISGTLTGVGGEWSSVSLGDIADVGTGTTPSRKEAGYWTEGKVPWITSALLNSSPITAAEQYVTERAVAETSLQLWPAGSLLLALYGEGKTRGKCAELAIEASCNQACAAIRVRDPSAVARRYLKLFFDASYQANRRLASGGVQNNLNLGLVKAIQVPLPPLAEQQAIVENVERQMSFIQACEKAVDEGLAKAAALRRAVLKAAFEGELVPQDPSEEPASVLLERIRKERAEAG
jgi:type I restriction enzyme S subunit